LTEFVVDELLDSASDVIDRATIAEDGALMHRFKYLEDYLNN
jgi:hypothetical protein